MADTDKSKGNPVVKSVPKDGQVITAIIKEMGISDYDPKTVMQLTELVYRYSVIILEDARSLAGNSKKKNIDVEDVRAALQLSNETLITTPPREVLTECSQIKNKVPLPVIKPHCGLRVPNDRFCLTTTNYVLRSQRRNKNNGISDLAGPGIKILTKPTVSYVKRTTGPPPLTQQTITVPKLTTQKTVFIPKMQQSDAHVSSLVAIDNHLKRKREDEDN